jgi:phosphoesterase RecJ-like protein
VSLKKVIACIKKNNRFLITAHTNPEGDALGSELAFYNLVRSLGKEAVIVNEDNLPYGHEFLPGGETIKKFGRDTKNIKFDVFVVLDCSDLKRTGEVYRLNADNKTILNIDHHISNINFGAVNWVRPYASCACEMVYEIYKVMRLPIDKDTAIALYTGIMADTGSFRYSNTSAFTHKVAAELLKHKLDVRQIYRSIYENMPFADAKLLAEILPTIKRSFGGKVVWFEVKKSILKKRKKISIDLTEHLLTFARAIKGAEVALIFKENFVTDSEIRINFRSQGKVDVNKIAQEFGGGGHKAAAGATVHGKIETIRNKVLAKVKEAL